MTNNVSPAIQRQGSKEAQESGEKVNRWARKERQGGSQQVGEEEDDSLSLHDKFIKHIIRREGPGLVGEEAERRSSTLYYKIINKIGTVEGKEKEEGEGRGDGGL